MFFLLCINSTRYALKPNAKLCEKWPIGKQMITITTHLSRMDVWRYYDAHPYSYESVGQEILNETIYHMNGEIGEFDR